MIDNSSQIQIIVSWNEFKLYVSARNMQPQFVQAVVDGRDGYYLYAQDGFLFYKCTIICETDDCLDFENNYKSNWNKQLSFVDSSGIKQIIPSARPIGTTTFFSGTGDNDITLDFDMTDQDSSIAKDLAFNEDVWIKDGGLQFIDAPFGAYFTVEAVHPLEGIIAKFCRKVFILGTGSYELNSEDKTLLPQGLILRVKVFNASTPTNFKAVGWIEGFRSTMV